MIASNISSRSCVCTTTVWPADTRRWINVGLTLVHRLRRWTNVNPTLIQRLVSAGWPGFRIHVDDFLHEFPVGDLYAFYLMFLIIRPLLWTEHKLAQCHIWCMHHAMPSLIHRPLFVCGAYMHGWERLWSLNLTNCLNWHCSPDSLARSPTGNSDGALSQNMLANSQLTTHLWIL